MTTPRTLKVVRPSLLTWLAVGATLAIVVGSAAFLYQSYPSLPDVLPVRFNARSRPVGWQYKTYARVLIPALVEGAAPGQTACLMAGDAIVGHATIAAGS